MSAHQHCLSQRCPSDPRPFSESDRSHAAAAAAVEVAARLAVRRAMEKTGLSREQIGIVFISPCPSKVTFSQAPLGTDHSEIDSVIAIKDIYPAMLPLMKRAEKAPQDLSLSGRIGIGWGGSGGEAGGLIIDSYLAADGIENVIHVLEDMEDEKFTELAFIETERLQRRNVSAAC